MAFVTVDGRVPGDGEQEAFFVLKKSDKDDVIHAGIEHRDTTPKFRWSGSAMERIMKRKRLCQDAASENGADEEAYGAPDGSDFTSSHALPCFQ